MVAEHILWTEKIARECGAPPKREPTASRAAPRRGAALRRTGRGAACPPCPAVTTPARLKLRGPNTHAPADQRQTLLPGAGGSAAGRGPTAGPRDGPRPRVVRIIVWAVHTAGGVVGPSFEGMSDARSRSSWASSWSSWPPRSCSATSGASWTSSASSQAGGDRGPAAPCSAPDRVTRSATQCASAITHGDSCCVLAAVDGKQRRLPHVGAPSRR